MTVWGKPELSSGCWKVLANSSVENHESLDSHRDAKPSFLIKETSNLFCSDKVLRKDPHRYRFRQYQVHCAQYYKEGCNSFTNVSDIRPASLQVFLHWSELQFMKKICWFVNLQSNIQLDDLSYQKRLSWYLGAEKFFLKTWNKGYAYKPHYMLFSTCSFLLLDETSHEFSVSFVKFWGEIIFLFRFIQGSCMFTLLLAFWIFPPKFWGTYKWYFVILWMQVEWGTFKGSGTLIA